MARTQPSKGRAQIKGLKEAEANLNKELRKITDAGVKGLVVAAIIIRRDMDSLPPKIPVDFGNLRSSWFTVTAKGVPGEAGEFPLEFKGELGPQVSFDREQLITELQGKAETSRREVVYTGFGANYAAPVHEMVGKDINWQRSGSGAKFFEAAINRNIPVIVDRVKNLIEKR